MSSYYSENELKEIGFFHIGENVMISRKASIYNPNNIQIGKNVRIDDFCILSGKIKIGNFIHIAAYSALFGGNEGIELADFAGLSSRCTIYAASDDYSGESMTNPTVPDKYKNIKRGKVEIGKHVIIGANSIILPGVKIEEGCSIGAISLINKSTDSWGIYSGIPAKRIKDRSKKLLILEEKFKQDLLGQ